MLEVSERQAEDDQTPPLTSFSALTASLRHVTVITEPTARHEHPAWLPFITPRCLSHTVYNHGEFVKTRLNVYNVHLPLQAMNGAPPTPSTSAMFSLSQAVTTSTSTSTIPTPPELEQTLALLSGHRSVLGYLLVSRGHPVSIIRHSGVVFEGEQGRKYATAIGRMVESVQGALEEVSGEPNEGVRYPSRPSAISR